MNADLEVWRPWPGLGALATQGFRTVKNCRFGDRVVNVVAVGHPSSRISDEQRKIEAALVAAAAVAHS